MSKRKDARRDKARALRGRVFLTRLGWVGIAWSGRGLAAVAGPARRAQAAEEELGERIGDFSSVPEPPTRGLGWALEEKLRAYMDGQRVSFDEPVDLSRMSAFVRRVLEAARSIPYGEVRTYARVAAEAGNPRAARATGQALGANPMPIVVPCHRVVTSSGRLGGYRGGLALKARLLALEGQPVRQARA